MSKEVSKHDDNHFHAQMHALFMTTDTYHACSNLDGSEYLLKVKTSGNKLMLSKWSRHTLRNSELKKEVMKNHPAIAGMHWTRNNDNIPSMFLSIKLKKLRKNIQGGKQKV